MKPVQRREISRNRDEVARRSSSSRSMMEYDKWVERIKSSDSLFGKSSNRSPGAWSSRILPNSKSLQFDREEELHWLDKRADSDTDGAASPILSKKSPSRENSYMKHGGGESGYLSTRTQEIAVYRKEMMEMARGLPEEELELTLRDIVEKRKEFKEAEPAHEKIVEDSVKHEKETEDEKNQKKDLSVAKSNSMETGLLVKMLLPLSVALRRKSFNLLDRGEKVLEKKEVIETKKSKDEEWWEKNEFSEKGSSKASSVGSSSNSSGDDHFSRNMSMKKTKCYCFRPGKSKTKSR